MVFTKDDSKPIAVQSNLDTRGISVIKIITDAKVIEQYLASKGDQQEPRSQISIESAVLTINPPAIIFAFQSVVENYPGQSFGEDSVVIEEPHAVWSINRRSLRIPHLVPSR